MGDRPEARPSEWRRASQHLIEHAAQRIDVAPPVQVALGTDLLGTHVGRRAHGEPSLGYVVAGRLGNGPRDAKIGDHCLTLVQQNVLRLDVAMYHVLPMGVVQRPRHRDADPHRLLGGKSLLALQLRAQRFAPYVGHHEPERTVDGAGVVQWKDRWVAELGGDADLPQEAGCLAAGVNQLGAQHLECDPALVLEVFGQVHRGHPAMAQFFADTVPVAEGLAQPLEAGAGVVQDRAHRRVGISVPGAWIRRTRGTGRLPADRAHHTSRE